MLASWLIAAKDFKSGFSTPRTGALIFFLLGISAIFFATFVQSFVAASAQNPMGMGGGGNTPPIQELIKGLIYNLQFLLVLILPAVTMGAFADELKTQTIRFLQTAPISSWSVVFGKYLSRFFTLLFAVLLCSVFPLYFVIYGNPEPMATLVGYLGLMLLISYQVAFGIWVSSLTSQQFLAFLFTMLGIFTFFILDFVAPKIAGSGVLSNVLQYLAPLSHFESFLNGVISVEDVSYFVLMTICFLFFANVSYDSKRWR
ncbi:MAG: ABC transporter permease subunit [Proteobacteria bacterium]|nr:ABC transporter permease subunit [Pseudomonadota bacterium]